MKDVEGLGCRVYPGARERADEPVVNAPESVVACVCDYHRPGGGRGRIAESEQAHEP